MSIRSVGVLIGSGFLLLGVGAMGISHGPSGKNHTFANATGTFGSGFSQLAALQRPIVPESPELVLLGKTGIRANIPPVTVTPQVLGAIVGGIDTGVNPEVFRYVIEAGDTPAAIAETFQVSLNTILWANDILASSVLTPGNELVVLPTSGTLHLVRQNDTLSEIAVWYKGDVKEIMKYNGLASAQDLYAGDFVIIPEGVQPASVPSGRLTPIANSYFIYPLPAPHHVTQGLHAYNAIDFSNGQCGEPVYAAAGGTIQRTGYHTGGGNYVRILHPNGVVTYYGHFSRIIVQAGDRVFQGETIGYTGYTGYTIPAGPGGCHVHFEVRGAANPFR
jgi:LysM repeat protein